MEEENIGSIVQRITQEIFISDNNEIRLLWGKCKYSYFLCRNVAVTN